MSTLGVPLAVGGVRTTGTPVRTQNGMYLIYCQYKNKYRLASERLDYLHVVLFVGL